MSDKKKSLIGGILILFLTVALTIVVNKEKEKEVVRNSPFKITEIDSLKINHKKEHDTYWGGNVITTIEISGKIKNNEILVIRPDIELEVRLHQKNGEVIENESIFGNMISSQGSLTGFDNTYITLIDGITTGFAEENWDNNKTWKPGTELTFYCISPHINNVIFEYEIEKAELYLNFSADDPITNDNILHDDIEETLEIIDITYAWKKSQNQIAENNIEKESKPKKEISKSTLYGTTKINNGISLELKGWSWDFIPKINSNSNENGRIVFQITIDDDGYVVGVKTLEKTVSLEIEMKYRQAVEALSFSKTPDNIRSSPTSTGKITFIVK